MSNSLTLLIMPNKKPFLAAALICEKVLQEGDGVLTVMRIVDIFTIAPPPVPLPAGGIQGIELTVLLSLKSGDVRGKSEIAMKLRFPSGRVEEVGKWPIVLNGEGHGANVIAKVTLGVTEFGLHWFDVSWEGQAMTSVPLKLVSGVAS